MKTRAASDIQAGDFLGSGLLDSLANFPRAVVISTQPFSRHRLHQTDFGAPLVEQLLFWRPHSLKLSPTPITLSS